MATIFERLKAITVEQLGVEPEDVVHSASYADDLNADSLDLVELIMAIEEEFSEDDKKMEISDEDAANITTIQQTIDYLHDHGIEDK